MRRLSLRGERWGYVILLTLVIYATLYIARPLCTFLRGNIPFFDMAANILFAILLIVTFAITYRARRRNLIKKDSTYRLLIAAIFIYAVIIWRVELAEEKLHFFEYGILGFLTYRAFVVDIKGAKPYILAFILVSILGWIDEGIQYILPNRHYELKDVLMNGSGGLMGLVLTFIVNREKTIDDA